MESEKNQVTMLRYRGTKLSRVRKLDMFPKIEETYKEKSYVGGTLFTIVLIIWLIYSEINYYMHSNFVFKFSPDVDFDAKLKINVDITVAMPCSNSILSPECTRNSVVIPGGPSFGQTCLYLVSGVGADILDSTNQNAYRFGSLEEEDTWFELAPNQQVHFENKRHFNSYLRDEYHAIKDLLWRSSFSTMFSDMPARSYAPDRPYDACRIYGSLILNKVSGNFHITAGKSLNLPRGHIHISAFMSESDYNFTHRINRFSFGDPSPGIVHPLEGDELVTHEGMTLFNYFIEVVPTNVKTFLTSINTYQYSVKELSRPINHDRGSHGMPGIFFKYDVSALKVTVRQERDHLGMFLARLCSIVGGIYVCSGFLNSIVQFICNLILCNWSSTALKTKHQKLISDNDQTATPVAID